MADVNLSPGFFPRWNTKADAARGGTGLARILCVGDSTTQGTYAASYSATYPSVLHGLMNSWIPTQEGALWTDGDWNLNAPFLGPVSWTDSRVTKNSPWAVQALEGPQPEITMMGGGGWYTPSTTVNALSWAPGRAFDTIRVFYASSTGTGSFGINIGASNLGTTNTAVGSGLAVGTAAFTVAAGTYTINIQPVTTASVVILGIEAYLSTDLKVLLANGGSGGSKSSDWIIQGGKPWLEWYASVSFNNADLYIVSLGINDALAGYTSTAYNSNMTALIQHLQANGDVLLCTSVPSDTASDSGVAWALEQAYAVKLAALASSFGCGLVDLSTAGRFVDYSTANSNGYMSDIYHPNPAGYAFWADIMNTAVQAITYPTATASTITARTLAR